MTHSVENHFAIAITFYLTITCLVLFCAVAIEEYSVNSSNIILVATAHESSQPQYLSFALLHMPIFVVEKSHLIMYYQYVFSIDMVFLSFLQNVYSLSHFPEVIHFFNIFMCIHTKMVSLFLFLFVRSCFCSLKYLNFIYSIVFASRANEAAAAAPAPALIMMLSLMLHLYIYY